MVDRGNTIIGLPVLTPDNVTNPAVIVQPDHLSAVFQLCLGQSAIAQVGLVDFSTLGRPLRSSRSGRLSAVV